MVDRRHRAESQNMREVATFVKRRRPCHARDAAACFLPRDNG
jgi:hypothetical protein